MHISLTVDEFKVDACVNKMTWLTLTQWCNQEIQSQVFLYFNTVEAIDSLIGKLQEAKATFGYVIPQHRKD